MVHGRLGLCLFLLALSLTAAAQTAEAGNWPRFRGPNGSGIAQDQDIPITWTEHNLSWKKSLDGAGNSSPIVWGERLFLQSASKDGTERFLLCLSTRDGRLLWQRRVAGAKAKTNPRNTLASATPTTDGQRVYALFWDGKGQALHAFDLNGNPAWKYDLGSYVAEHGAGTSPIVHQGRVFLLNDHDKAAAVLAVDARSGQRRGRRPAGRTGPAIPRPSSWNARAEPPS